jgi:hypothetical protein
MIPIVHLSLMVPTNLLFHLAFTGWHKLRPVGQKADPSRAEIGS